MNKLLSKPTQKAVMSSLFMLSVLALLLTLLRIALTGGDRFWFLAWNLVLAWVPLVFAYILYTRTPRGLVWSWPNGLLFAGWILFLPNAFYLVSDFIHLSRLTEIEILYDIVLFQVYSLTGLLLGICALGLVHIRSVQRFGMRGHYIAAAALVLSSFAIYLGRYLRWNSWDVIINPFAILFDITDRVLNPTQHVPTFTTTLLFFVFLGTIYVCAWRISQSLRR